MEETVKDSSVNKPLVCILNLLGILMGVWFAVAGLPSVGRPQDICYSSFNAPTVIAGLFLCVMCFHGLCSAGLGAGANRIISQVYLFFVLITILALTITMISEIAVMKKGSNRVEFQKEFRLGQFSHWLQNHFTSDEEWPEVKACLQKVDPCEKLRSISSSSSSPSPSPSVVVLSSPRSSRADKYHYEEEEEKEQEQEQKQKELSPLQTGCCRPPPRCGYKHLNGTEWYLVDKKAADSKKDCLVWDNRPKQMCLDCESCKAGFVAEVVWSWKKNLVSEIGFLASLIFIFGLSFNAYRSNYNYEQHQLLLQQRCQRQRLNYLI